MSGQHALETTTAPTQQADGDAHVTDRPRQPKRVFPDDYGPALYAGDLAEIWNISVSQIYRLSAEGAFDFAINKPRVGRKSWSRDRVRQYFAGELRGLTVARKRS